MIADIRFQGLWDCTTRTRFERTLRECIGNAPDNEGCDIVVTSYGSYCVLLAKTSRHSFRKVFALRGSEFGDALSAWLQQFHLRDATKTPDGQPVDEKKWVCPYHIPTD